MRCDRFRALVDRSRSHAVRLKTPFHLLIIAVVLLPLLGAKRLLEMGRSLGGGRRAFRDGLLGANPSPRATTRSSPRPSRPIGPAPRRRRARSSRSLPPPGNVAMLCWRIGTIQIFLLRRICLARTSSRGLDDGAGVLIAGNPPGIAWSCRPARLARCGGTRCLGTTSRRGDRASSVADYVTGWPIALRPTCDSSIPQRSRVRVVERLGRAPLRARAAFYEEKGANARPVN